MAIVSIALLAALRAAGQGTNNAAELRARLIAGWVAENRLAEHRGKGDWPSLGIQRGIEHQAGIELAWREEVIGTPNRSFRRVDVFVYSPAVADNVLAHVTGFVVNPPAPGP